MQGPRYDETGQLISYSVVGNPDSFLIQKKIHETQAMNLISKKNAAMARLSVIHMMGSGALLGNKQLSKGEVSNVGGTNSPMHHNTTTSPSHQLNHNSHAHTSPPAHPMHGLQ